MNRKSQTTKSQKTMTRVSRRGFSAGLGAVGFIAGTAPFNIVRAQGAALKVGVLLPRTGVPRIVSRTGVETGSDGLAQRLSISPVRATRTLQLR